MQRSWLFLILLASLCMSTSEADESSHKERERERIRAFHIELGIPEDYEQQTGLPVQLPPRELKSIGKDMYGRAQRLSLRAAEAWKNMQEAATRDGVSLLLVSAFRPPDYQASLLRRKLRAGESIEQALQAVAAPGHSEHQSGRAIDLACAGCPVLETEFEETNTFAWLQQRAGEFGFVLSYPRDNPHGVMYEPWHWCYRD